MPEYQVASQVIGIIGADLSPLRKAYAQAKSETNQQQGWFKSVASSIASTAGGFLLGGALQTGIGALVNFFKDGVTEGITFNATLETTTQAFTTLLKNGPAATSMIQSILAFSAKTPFQFLDLTNAAHSLLAFGFNAKSILPDLTAIGDASSGNASALHSQTDVMNTIVQVLGKINTQGKVNAIDMMQLSDVGINGWKLIAQGMGLTVAQVQELSKKGKLLSTDALPAMIQGFKNLYGGDMQRQSTTFNGLMSTLHDNIQIALGALTGPIFDEAKTGIGDLVTILSSATFQNVAKTIGQDIAGALQQAGKFAQSLGDDFSAAFDDKNGAKVANLRDLAKGLLDKLQDLGGWTKDHLTPALHDMASAAGSVTDWISHSKQHFDDVKQWWKDWGGLITGAGTAITVWFLPAMVAAATTATVKSAVLAATWVAQVVKTGLVSITSAGQMWMNTFSFTGAMVATAASATKNAVILGATWTAQIIATGVKAGWSALMMTGQFIAAIAKTVATAAIDAAVLYGTWIGAIVATGVQAIIAGGRMTIAFIGTMLKVGTQAITTSGEVDTLAASETAAGDAGGAAIGVAGVGLAAGAGILGLAAAIALLGYFSDQATKAIGGWLAQQIGSWVQTQIGYIKQLIDWIQQLWNTMGGNTPNHSPIPTGATGTSSGGHASGGFVGPNEMLSRLNDANGAGELVHLPSGSYVFPHQQSVSILQQMNTGNTDELLAELRSIRKMLAGGAAETINMNGLTTPQAFDQALTVRNQRKAWLYGR